MAIKTASQLQPASTTTGYCLSTGETAWIGLLPATILATVAIALFSKPLGKLLFKPTSFEYWASSQSQLQPKPSQLAAYVLVLLFVVGFAVVVGITGLRGTWQCSARTARGAVLGTQLLLLSAAVACLIAQPHVVVDDVSRGYFTVRTIVIAVMFATCAAFLLARPRVLARISVREGVRSRCSLTVVAIAATVMWLLPAVHTDASIGSAQPLVVNHLPLAFDETMSVLDGRSPLVNMVAYGSLWPYVVAPLLALSGASLAGFAGLMTAASALSLLAIHGMLRRVTRHAGAALALYLPFLATSFFREQGDLIHRYSPGDYFGMFPLRYAGPYLLAWLTVRQLDGARPRREEAVFAFAGLVALNNVDFGLPALAATIASMLCARPPRSRAAALQLARSVATGLVIALALVTTLTLLRDNSLPHLSLLVRYGKLFGTSGFGNLPTPLIGFHLVMLASAVAAIVVAVARTVRHHPDTILTGALAWSGLFGLGAGAYFVYRSHPDVLIDLFSIWALTLALLLITIIRSIRSREPRRLMPIEIGILIAFGLAACSLAQMPVPWSQVERISSSASTQLAARTRHGEPVVILTTLGHRLAYDTGVVDVAAYTGMPQMPSMQQFDETLDTLLKSGGTRVFLGSGRTVGDAYWPEIPAALESAAFVRGTTDPTSGFTEYAIANR